MSRDTQLDVRPESEVECELILAYRDFDAWYSTLSPQRKLFARAWVATGKVAFFCMAFRIPVGQQHLTDNAQVAGTESAQQPSLVGA